MSYKKQSILCAVISCFILAAMLFACSYCILRGVARQDTPFELSPNFVVLEASESGRVKTDQVLDADKDQDIIVLSEYTGQNYMAIYDPVYYFYNEKTIDFLGTTRYFSGKDYREKTSTGIYVSSEENPIDAFNEMEKEGTELVHELLFSINPMSKLYKENTECIVNQMSLDELGDRVYIDSRDTGARDRIKEALLKEGYSITDSGYTGVRNAFMDGLKKGGLYTKIVLLPAVSLYIIFLFTCIMYFFNNKEILDLHKLHGGKRSKMFLLFSKHFLLVNAIGSLLVIFFYAFLVRGEISLQFKLWEYGVIWLFHVGITDLGYYLGFFIHYRRGREWNAVK